MAEGEKKASVRCKYNRERSSEEFLEGSEELQAVQAATGRYTCCLHLPANFLAEMKIVTLFVCDATITVCLS